MLINAELSQIPIAEGRSATRRIVNLAAALRDEGVTTHPILILDIAAGGFKAETAGGLETGYEVWLKLPGHEAKRSRVVWVEGKQAGCAFENPLHAREVAAIAAPRPRALPRNLFGRV